MLPPLLRRLPVTAGAVSACLLLASPAVEAQVSKLFTIERSGTGGIVPAGRFERSGLPPDTFRLMRQRPARLARSIGRLPGGAIPSPILPDTLQVLVLRLEFTPDSIDEIASEAITRNTGARGLRSILEGTMLELMYEIPSRGDVSKIVVTPEVIKKEVNPLTLTEGEEKSA